MLRVAMLSKWHVHADGYAKKLQAMPGVTIRYVWDGLGIWARCLSPICPPCWPETMWTRSSSTPPPACTRS